MQLSLFLPHQSVLSQESTVYDQNISGSFLLLFYYCSTSTILHCPHKALIQYLHSCCAVAPMETLFPAVHEAVALERRKSVIS